MTSDLENDRFWHQFLAPSQIKTGSPPTGLPAIEAPRKTSRLCWVARMVCLVPWIAAPWWGLVVDAVSLGSMSETRFPFNLPLAMWLSLSALFIYCSPLWVCALIAWRRHLLGGTLLVLSSGLFISWISVSGRIREFVIITAFTVCVVFLLGGILHLVVWWKEDGGKTT